LSENLAPPAGLEDCQLELGRRPSIALIRTIALYKKRAVNAWNRPFCDGHHIATTGIDNVCNHTVACPQVP
jgi:hypothetical protein